MTLIKPSAELVLEDTDVERFYAKVVKPKGKAGAPGCWVWSGAVGARGQGVIKIRGKQYNATRIAWMIRHEVWPGRKRIYHSCGNKLCVRSEHLVGENPNPKTTKAAARKKPRPDFPLFLHSSGQWAKKIAGETRYFGRDADQALARYVAERAELQAGEIPRSRRRELTVSRLCDEFIRAKRAANENGTLSAGALKDYERACDRIRDWIGKDRPVVDLKPSGFTRARERMNDELALSLKSQANAITHMRAVFHFAYKQGLIEVPVRFGEGFDKPSARDLRVERQGDETAFGARVFASDEIKTLLECAGPQMSAAILLGINAGLGSKEVGMMSPAVLNGPVDGLSGWRWMDYSRLKTGIQRRVPLWPETLAAIEAAKEERACPHGDYVLVTRRKRPYFRENDGGRTDGVGQEFGKLVRAQGLHVVGRSFYGLRRTFATIGAEAGDPPALAALMGHVDAAQTATYVARVDDNRLVKVVRHVHGWLGHAST